MCRHSENLAIGSGGQPEQEAKREVDFLLSDIANGLELSKNLLLLAEGPWEECDHAGRLPLQRILRECAYKIMTESLLCRMKLQAGGKVHFGAVAIEESAESDGPEQVDAPRHFSPPYLASSGEDPAVRSCSGIFSADRRKDELFSLGALRRLCNAFLARPPAGSPERPAARQGGA